MSVDWNVVVAIGTFGQFLVVLVAAVLGLRQLEHMRRQSELDASLPLLAWVRSAEYQEAYPLVLAAANDTGSRLRAALANGEHDDPAVRKVIAFADFLNEIGLLVEKDLIKGATIIPYYRRAIVITWDLLVPFVIRHRRDEHGSSFFAPLEALAVRAHTMSVEDRFSGLRASLPRRMRPAFDRSLAQTRGARAPAATHDSGERRKESTDELTS